MSTSEREQVNQSARRIVRLLTEFWTDLSAAFDEIDREEARKEQRQDENHKQENRHENS